MSSFHFEVGVTQKSCTGLEISKNLFLKNKFYDELK